MFELSNYGVFLPLTSVCFLANSGNFDTCNYADIEISTICYMSLGVFSVCQNNRFQYIKD